MHNCLSSRERRSKFSVSKTDDLTILFLDQARALAAEELVETSRAEARRLRAAAKEAVEQARAHDSRAAAHGWHASGLLAAVGVDVGSPELAAAEAAREKEAALRKELAREEERLRGLVADTDAAWAAEGVARDEADRALLAAAEREAAYRRERSSLTSELNSVDGLGNKTCDCRAEAERARRERNLRAQEAAQAGPVSCWVDSAHVLIFSSQHFRACNFVVLCDAIMPTHEHLLIRVGDQFSLITLTQRRRRQGSGWKRNKPALLQPPHALLQRYSRFMVFFARDQS